MPQCTSYDERPEVVCKVSPCEVRCSRRAQFIPWANIVKSKIYLSHFFSRKNASPIPHLVESNVLGNVLGKLGGVPRLSRHCHHQSKQNGFEHLMFGMFFHWGHSLLFKSMRETYQNLSERLKNLFWSLFITMIDLQSQVWYLVKFRIWSKLRDHIYLALVQFFCKHQNCETQCFPTWHWSDPRPPWQSRQTASLSDTPSCSLKYPQYKFLKCFEIVGSQFSRVFSHNHTSIICELSQPY